uniref:Uncharacterized protein n=1 Tax=Romanomermis culicivorax TaxID=13658 RepID=A0A915KDB3_ROMCU
MQSCPWPKNLLTNRNIFCLKFYNAMNYESLRKPQPLFINSIVTN